MIPPNNIVEGGIVCAYPRCGNYVGVNPDKPVCPACGFGGDSE